MIVVGKMALIIVLMMAGMLLLDAEPSIRAAIGVGIIAGCGELMSLVLEDRL